MWRALPLLALAACSVDRTPKSSDEPPPDNDAGVVSDRDAGVAADAGSIEEGPTAEDLFNAAERDRQDRECHQAISQYEQLIQEFPDSSYVPRAWNGLGLTEAKCSHDCAEAETAYDTLRMDYPDYPQSEWAESQEQYGGGVPGLLYEIGECYFDNGELLPACSFLGDLNVIYPDNFFFDTAERLLSWCPAPGAIDPSKDCDDHPPYEVEIRYADGVEELPGERAELQEKFASIDARFTSGLHYVEIADDETNCPVAGQYAGNAMRLCRKYKYLGWIEDHTGTIWHEIGHFVSNKIGAKRLEYYDLVRKSYPDQSDEEFYDQHCRRSELSAVGDIASLELCIDEFFAANFEFYRLAGPYYRTFLTADNPEPQTAERYAWMRDTLFCGEEYDKNFFGSAQLGMALFYFDKNDYPRAIEAFNKLKDNYEDDNFYLGDHAKARYYLGIIHFEQGDYQKAIAELEIFINDLPEEPIERDHYSLPDSLQLPRAYYTLASSYYEVGRCADAVMTLDTMNLNYPGNMYEADAQLIIDACTP